MGGPQGEPKAHPSMHLASADQGSPNSLEQPPNTSPLPHQPPHSPTSAPTDPPTSCHCLGLNPSSAPAAWRAQPGWGAAGPQGRPLMPRRVGGQGLGAGLGVSRLASTSWACLSAACLLQRPGRLIKNRWAGRSSSAAAQPGRSPRPSSPLQAASSPGQGRGGGAERNGAVRGRLRSASPAGSGYCDRCHRLHLPFRCPDRGGGRGAQMRGGGPLPGPGQ